MNNADVSSDWSNDIKDLNLGYLVLAQNVLKQNRGRAMLQLGLSNEAADMLLAMSVQDLTRLASNNFLLLSFRLDQLSIQTVLQNEKTAALRPTHISILLASQRAPAAPPLALAA